ncbi:hypothetical protein K450DRAFT_238513 [Umbelopsis ramanniana AG]|uniref:START domain-containing protein n=1 Tax=Umbelopsis ramanniana AG TaxID=1314678 RepID=A0AAD5EA55_UMBRA|nr:uncharacterized protein K450DRAFT_238513 [Umbelopsis ramanniana AG]KAI8580176.1 hypothetical protein K450DRAFT_238513 [Umbelopsis ramanniana AG]
MTIIESNNRHAETTRKALAYLKELTGSLDGWDFSSESNGVKLYSKTVDGQTLPIVRGDTILPGKEYTLAQVAAVATSPGSRKVWDEKFDVAEVKETFNFRETLFWSRLKTPWPMSPRDIAGTAIRDIGDDAVYVSMTSVEDADIPEVYGNVRATLYVSGWKAVPVEEGIAVTYVTQIDIAGSIPSSFLASIQQQIPLCAGKVIDYIQTHGYPPYITEASAVTGNEHFTHAEKEYTLEIEGGEAGSVVKIDISSKLYPAGVNVNIQGSGSHKLEDGVNGNKVLVIENIDGSATVTITSA